MPTFQAPTRTRRLPGTRSCILAIAFMLSTLGGSVVPGLAQSDVSFQPNWYMVVDWANLLDNEQEQTAINDAWRLNMRGVPAQVVTEFAQSTPELARQRAAELRLDHGIESQPGADDGIVIYAVVNANDRSQVLVAISAGENALPHGGLTQADLDQITSTIVLPQLTSGHPARAIVYSLRDMIYNEIFTPPPAVPLSGWRAALNAPLTWVAPVVAVATARWSIRGLNQVSTFQQAVEKIVPMLVAASMLGLLAVLGQSGVAGFSAIALVGMAVLIAMRADHSISGGRARAMTVSPRPPGGFASRGGRL